MAATRGFTLIEILVVLTIVGVMIGGALLSFGLVGDDQRHRQDAERLQAVLDYLRDRAELEGREYGLRLDDDGYQVLRFEPRQRAWVEPAEDSLSARRWRADDPPELRVDGRPVRLRATSPEALEVPRPQLGVDAVGEFTVFALRFSAPNGRDILELAPNPEGRLDLASEGSR